MEYENKTNKQTMIIVAFLCAGLFGLAVAYAALSATVNVTFGKVTQNALSWNVGFETGTTTATESGSTGVVCGEATTTANTVSIANTTLTTLHDKCLYKLKIQNTGSIDAILQSISPRVPTSMSCNTTTTSQMVCGNITYKLTSDQEGLSLLDVNNTLSANTGTLDVYLSVEYTGTETGANNQQSAGGFTFNYVQK